MPGRSSGSETLPSFFHFDWAGVVRAGVFNVASPYTWDLSNPDHYVLPKR